MEKYDRHATTAFMCCLIGFVICLGAIFGLVWFHAATFTENWTDENIYHYQAGRLADGALWGRDNPSLYFARGDIENRIKEQQFVLFGDRTSCHRWRANQFRVLILALAYILHEAILLLSLQGSELANAQATIIQTNCSRSAQ